MDEDNAARLGEIVSLKRLAAGVEAHVALDDAYALCLGDNARPGVLGEQGGVVVTLKEPCLYAVERIRQEARVGGKDQSAHLGVRHHEAQRLGGIVLHVEGEHPEPTYTERLGRVHGMRKRGGADLVGERHQRALGGV